VEQKIAKMPHAKANDQLERMSSFFFMITPRNMFLFIVICSLGFNNLKGITILLRKPIISLRISRRFTMKKSDL